MAVRASGLQSSIWNNNLKSVGLLALYPFLILGMIWAIAAAIGLFISPNNDPQIASLLGKNVIQTYWPAIIGVVVGWFAISYFFHTSMIRKMSHSHPVTRKEEPELYNLLENLCISIGMPLPRLEIIESHARNAFASGINEKTFTVTVTRGLMQSLAKDELEGVLAHELAHIQHRDVRLLIITIIFTGMIGFAAQVMWSQVRYGMRVRPMMRSSGGNGNRGNGMIILMVILAVLWLGYMATLFTRFALSRRREYMADAGAVQMTKNPDGMMRALMRIAGKDQIPKMPGDINMLCFENRVPFMGLFATHPPIEKRIQTLSRNTGFAVPDLPQLRPFHAARADRQDTISPPKTPRENWTTRQRLRSRRTDNPWY